MRAKFKAIEHVDGLNSLRLDNISYSDKILRERLRECGIPSNPIFVSELKKFGIIDKVGKDTYIFSNPDKPIHYKFLQDVYSSYRNKLKQYKSNAMHKRELEDDEVVSAIKLLKEKGFEIYSPVGMLYSKLLILNSNILLIRRCYYF